MKFLLILLMVVLCISPVFAGSESVITTDDDDQAAYRIMLASGDNPHGFGKNSVYTYDDNGYLCTRSVIGAGGTVIPTSTNLSVESLRVGCDSMTPTSGTVNALIYSSCGDSAITMQLTTGSASTTLFQVNNKTADKKFSVDLSGNVYATAYVGGGYVQGSTFISKPGEAWNAQLRDNTKSFLFNDNTASTVASIDSAGKGTFDGGVETASGTGVSIGGTAPADNYLSFTEASVKNPTNAVGVGTLSFDGLRDFRLNGDGTTAGNLTVGNLSSNRVYTDFIHDGPEAVTWFTDGTADDATITATATLTTAQHAVRVDSSGGTAITLSLPASPTAGEMHEIKCTDYLGVITIDGNGKLIDGSSTFTFSAKYECFTFKYYGTEWGIK